MFNEININFTQFDITFEGFELSPSCLAYSAFYFELWK